MICLGPSGFGAAGKEAQCSRFDQHQAFLRRLVPAVLSSSAGCSFLFRPPDTGNKSDAWRRSGVAFVRWPLPALPAFAGDSFARLRFKAAIRPITGGASVTARGLID